MKNTLISFVGAIATGFLFTCMALAPAVVHAADAPVQLVRTGDRQMTCDALAAEINTLAQPVSMTQAEQPKKKHGFGFLRVLGSAVPIVGMGNAIGGALVSGAAAASSMQGSTEAHLDRAMQAADAAMAGPSIAQQRKERLSAIFEEKRC